MNDGSLIDVTALKRNARNRIEAMYERSSVNVKFETRSSTFTFTLTRIMPLIYCHARTYARKNYAIVEILLV